MLERFLRLRLSIRHKTAGHIAEIIRRRCMTSLLSGFAVQIKPTLRQVHWRQERDIRITMLCGPFDRLDTANTGDPYRRMGLLDRRSPRIHVAEMKMLALPSE